MNAGIVPHPNYAGKPPPGSSPSAPRLSPADISALVPMGVFLSELGFAVNERTRRSACPLHKGSNHTAFSWTEAGQWFCFHCGAGGDRIELVKRVRGCGFRDAFQYLGTLAGVEVSDQPASRKEIEERKRERQRIDVASHKLEELECRLRARYRGEIHDLEAIRRNVTLRFREMRAGAGARVHGKAEFWWGGLDLVAKELPRALTSYSILSFANTRDRVKFSLEPEGRDKMIEEAMIAGYVTDDAGRTVGVVI